MLIICLQCSKDWQSWFYVRDIWSWPCAGLRGLFKDLQLITWWFTVHWRCWTYHVRTRACWAANVGNPHQEHLSEPTPCELMRWTASWHSQRGHHVSGSKGELDSNSIFSQGWSLNIIDFASELKVAPARGIQQRVARLQVRRHPHVFVSDKC